MKKQKLQLMQMDKKIRGFAGVDATIPEQGWLKSIRISLNMTLKQMGKRMGITPQSVREMEGREKNGNISLQTLRQAGQSMGLRLVYGFMPEAGSLENIIKNQARKKAKEIVIRTSRSMDLEDQKVSERQLEAAIEEKAYEIIQEMPRYLWD
jgi:predicted DNA-binding mobile mystery protein A